CSQVRSQTPCPFARRRCRPGGNRLRRLSPFPAAAPSCRSCLDGKRHAGASCVHSRAPPRAHLSREPLRAARSNLSSWQFTSMAFEILHRTLVLFGRGARFEGAEITTSAGFRI